MEDRCLCGGFTVARIDSDGPAYCSTCMAQLLGQQLGFTPGSRQILVYSTLYFGWTLLRVRYSKKEDRITL